MLVKMGLTWNMFLTLQDRRLQVSLPVLL